MTITNKILKIKLYALVGIAMLFSFQACKDAFNEHYSLDTEMRSDLNLIEYMQSRSDLGKFVELLEFTGYKDTLTHSQAYTVFALTNDALSDIEINESVADSLRLLVANHITGGTHVFPGIIKAFNGKYIEQQKEQGAFYYGNQKIVEPNLLTKNGVVHVLNTRVPYVMNIWEFIQNQPSLDSLRNYLNSISKLEFSPALSYDENSVFIDSVFVESNRFLNELGAINNELFLSSVILPSNAAWNELYGKIFPYYRSLDKLDEDSTLITGEEQQASLTKWSMVKDCVFGGLLEDPATKDSLRSTSGSVFKNPAYLFTSSEKYTLSNGHAYVTNQMKNKLTDSWLKPIIVEAESDIYQKVTVANCKLVTYSTFGSQFTASRNYFVRYEQLPGNDFSKVSVRFPIPNTLANVKYNIYCVFIPSNAINPDDTRPYRANFYLSYVDEEGNIITDKALPVESNDTNPDEITKLLIGENYQFPYCNLISGPASEVGKDINVYLKVENAARTRDERNGTYSRSIAIDYIILEPVID